jgi:hypothetical protein
MKIVQFILFLTALSFADIGYISAFRGEIKITRNNQTLDGFKGFKIEESDTIQTGDRSKAQIIFQDNTVVRLGKNSSLNIEKYLFDSKNNSDINLKIDGGFFDVVSGKISKVAPERFALKTKTATIGIRGTHFQGYTLADKEEVACLHGAIVVTTENQVFDLEAGEMVKFSLNGKDGKIENRKNPNLNLEEKYNIEISSAVSSAINEISLQGFETYGPAIGRAYNEIQNISDEVEAKYATALMFREAYSTTVETATEVYGEKIDVTGKLFENSISTFGYYENDSNYYWLDVSDNFTDYHQIVSKMGGFAENGDALKSWSGNGDNRKIDLYRGYFVGNYIDLENGSTSLSLDKSNKFNVAVDFGNRYSSSQIEIDGNLYTVVNIGSLNQYAFIDGYDAGLTLGSENIDNALYGFSSYFVGSNVDEVSGNLFLTNSEGIFYNLFFVSQKYDELDVYRKDISSNSEFSWGYWAWKYENSEEKFRGGWIVPKMNETPKDKIDEYIEQSVVAKYSGDVFGTYEDINGLNGGKFDGGSFSFNVDFSKKSIDGDINFNIRQNDISVEVSGDLSDATFDIKGENFIGDGKFFGSKAENIAGGFSSISSEKDLVIGAFKGSKD